VDLVREQAGDAQTVLAVGLVTDRPEGRARGHVLDPLDARGDVGDPRQDAILTNHPTRGREDDRSLLSIGRGGDHLPAGLLLGSERVQEPDRGGQTALAGAPRNHDERRAHLPAAELIHRAIDPPDQAFLPVGERERQACETAFVQAQFADEPDRLVGPPEGIGDRLVGPEPCGAAAVKRGHALN
jgi:hypothetical protein